MRLLYSILLKYIFVIFTAPFALSIPLLNTGTSTSATRISNAAQGVVPPTANLHEPVSKILAPAFHFRLEAREQSKKTGKMILGIGIGVGFGICIIMCVNITNCKGEKKPARPTQSRVEGLTRH
ncbi:hypothetical protein VTL71DRAFT_2949 [Oculimacula yallundae]|uniref:Transmembrane protein n=1 Tax=Oculimacula yallundae TaxID=86028 RepID=A0ABR4C5R1_9HELO